MTDTVFNNPTQGAIPDLSSMIGYGQYLTPQALTSAPLNATAPDTGFSLGNLFDGFNLDAIPGLGGTDSSSTDSSSAGGGTMGGLADLMGAITGIVGAVQGGKQLNLAQDSFDFQKNAYNQNAANQAQTTNTRLEDRQINRMEAAGGDVIESQYGTLEDYMAKNKVRTTSL